MIPILLIAGGVAALYCLGGRPFFRAIPGRGAPDMTNHSAANRKARRRSLLLLDAGRLGDSLQVCLGNLWPCLEHFSKGMIIFGSPGSGKTTLMNIYLKSLMPLFRLHRGRTRIVILDCKNELPCRLQNLLPSHVPLYLLNPMDSRVASLAWAVIFPEREDATALADMICPDVPGDAAPYFRETSRHLIAAVIRVFQSNRRTATRDWRLYDLVAVCVLDRKYLKRVLRKNCEAYAVYQASLHHKTKSGGDVYSTLRGAVAAFADVALADKNATHRFDLKRFMESDGVAVLGLPPKGTKSILPLYGLLIKRIIDEARSQPPHPENRLFLQLDELSLIGRTATDSIIDAGALGRSVGVHVMAATQSIPLLEERLGKDKAEALLSTLVFTVGFRIADHRTAQWVSHRFGSQEGIITLVSHTSGGQGANTRTVSEQFVTRAVCMPEHLMHHPLADPVRDTLSYYATGPDIGNVYVAGNFLEQAYMAEDPNFSNYEPARSNGLASIEPLTEADWTALGLS